MDLPSHTSDTNYPIVDMSIPLYPSKSEPVVNMFLCYFQSPRHNRKPRMSTFGGVGVSTFTCSFTSVCPRSPAFTNAHTPLPTPTYVYVSRHLKREHKCKLCVKKCAQVYQSEGNFSINTFKVRTKCMCIG